MKKYPFFLIIAGILLMGPAKGDTPETMFSEANELYKRGKFKKAYKLYKKIPNKSAHVNYNLGNCAYKLNKRGHALLYWRRAERDWGFFNRGELVENIALLKNEQDQQQGPLLKSIIKMKNYFFSLTRSIPLIILQILFLFTWLFVFIYLRFLYKKQKNLLILVLFALTAIFGIILVLRYGIESRVYGVVTSEQATLLSGPGKSFQALQQLPQAQEVVIKKESSDYYKVKVFKRVGWVSKKDVKEI